MHDDDDGVINQPEALDPSKDRHRRRRAWGPWQLKPTTRELVIEEHPIFGGASHMTYAIDLDECLNSALVLDPVSQVAKKTWANDELVARLVVALDDVLGLQQHICGFGLGHRLTKADIARFVNAAHQASVAR